MSPCAINPNTNHTHTTMESVPVTLMLRPNKQTIKALLHTPGDTECPILQETISSISFDTLPRPFYMDHPSHTAITLDHCSHTFHAMALIYHWARSDSVLCPVCRSGPKGQRLSLRRLPTEWRYSLAARVRRQKHKDRAEVEADDRQIAIQMAHQQLIQPIILSISPMFIEIRIEVLSQINLGDLDTPLPLFWTMSSIPTRIAGSILFFVPAHELIHLPYPMGTLIRIVPRTSHLLQPLRPSAWFTAGMDSHPSPGFSIRCDAVGVQSICYTLSEADYDELMLEAFMTYNVLVAVPNSP